MKAILMLLVFGAYGCAAVGMFRERGRRLENWRTAFEKAEATAQRLADERDNARRLLREARETIRSLRGQRRTLVAERDALREVES